VIEDREEPFRLADRAEFEAECRRITQGWSWQLTPDPKTAA
jgi:hypothetical protein